jgi:hypothetical protein
MVNQLAFEIYLRPTGTNDEQDPDETEQEISLPVQ